MPGLLVMAWPWIVTGLGSVVAWEYVTGAKGEAETVRERITTNLGAVGMVAVALIGAAWVWRKAGR